jgi:adenosylcobinamide-GDP ribazoletransferase
MGFDAKSETRLLAAALTTLTRIPAPVGALRADWLARAAKYFPLVGALVGLVAGTVLVGAAQLWPQPIPTILAIVAGLLVTGALHEDGLADLADSTGARDRSRKLAIMKDPRIGAFGAVALMAALALKAACLGVLPVPEAVAALVAAGSASRLWAVIVMARSGYAGDRDVAKLDHGIEGPNPSEIALALAFALVPLLFLDVGASLAGLGCSAVAAALVALPAIRALGGYTGDVLGAVVTASEVAFLLGAAARL